MMLNGCVRALIKLFFNLIFPFLNYNIWYVVITAFFAWNSKLSVVNILFIKKIRTCFWLFEYLNFCCRVNIRFLIWLICISVARNAAADMINVCAKNHLLIPSMSKNFSWNMLLSSCNWYTFSCFHSDCWNFDLGWDNFVILVPKNGKLWGIILGDFQIRIEWNLNYMDYFT